MGVGVALMMAATPAPASAAVAPPIASLPAPQQQAIADWLASFEGPVAGVDPGGFIQLPYMDQYPVDAFQAIRSAMNNLATTTDQPVQLAQAELQLGEDAGVFDSGLTLSDLAPAAISVPEVAAPIAAVVAVGGLFVALTSDSQTKPWSATGDAADIAEVKLCTNAQWVLFDALPEGCPPMKDGSLGGFHTSYMNAIGNFRPMGNYYNPIGDTSNAIGWGFEGKDTYDNCAWTDPHRSTMWDNNAGYGTQPDPNAPDYPNGQHLPVWASDCATTESLGTQPEYVVVTKSASTGEWYAADSGRCGGGPQTLGWGETAEQAAQSGAGTEWQLVTWAAECSTGDADNPLNNFTDIQQPASATVWTPVPNDIHPKTGFTSDPSQLPAGEPAPVPSEAGQGVSCCAPDGPSLISGASGGLDAGADPSQPPVNMPGLGPIRQKLQQVFDANPIIDPALNLVTIPSPNYDELATHYVERLNQLGLGNVVVHDAGQADYNPFLQPLTVTTVYPAPGTQLDPTTSPQVDVYRNPAAAPGPGAGSVPGSDPAGQPIATPQPDPGDGLGQNPVQDPSGTTSCGGLSCPRAYRSPQLPAIRFPAITTPCHVFPFGVPCWIADQFTALEATPQAPQFSVPTPYGSAHVDLGNVFGFDVSSAMDVVRPVLAFLIITGFVLWLARRGSGEHGSGDSGESEDV